MKRKRLLIVIVTLLIIVVLTFAFSLNFTELDPIEHFPAGEISAEEWIRATGEYSLESDGTLLDTFNDYQDFVDYCGFEKNERYNEEFFSNNSLILYGADANVGRGPIFVFDTIFDEDNSDFFRMIRYIDIKLQGTGTAEVIHRLYFIEVSDSNIDNDNIDFKFGFFGD